MIPRQSIRLSLNTPAEQRRYLARIQRETARSAPPSAKATPRAHGGPCGRTSREAWSATAASRSARPPPRPPSTERPMRRRQPTRRRDAHLQATRRLNPAPARSQAFQSTLAESFPGEAGQRDPARREGLEVDHDEAARGVPHDQMERPDRGRRRWPGRPVAPRTPTRRRRPRPPGTSADGGASGCRGPSGNRASPSPRTAPNGSGRRLSTR